MAPVLLIHDAGCIMIGRGAKKSNEWFKTISFFSGNSVLLFGDIGWKLSKIIDICIDKSEQIN